MIFLGFYTTDKAIYLEERKHKAKPMLSVGSLQMAQKKNKPTHSTKLEIYFIPIAELKKKHLSSLLLES